MGAEARVRRPRRARRRSPQPRRSSRGVPRERRGSRPDRHAAPGQRRIRRSVPLGRSLRHSVRTFPTRHRSDWRNGRYRRSGRRPGRNRRQPGTTQLGRQRRSRRCALRIRTARLPDYHHATGRARRCLHRRTRRCRDQGSRQSRCRDHRFVELDHLPPLLTAMPSKPKSALSKFSVTKPGQQAPITPPPPKPDPKGTADEQYRKKTVRIREGAARQLGRLRADTRQTEQDLMAEALNLLFEKYDLPVVA